MNLLSGIEKNKYETGKKRVLMVSCLGLGIGGVQNVMMNIVRKLTGKYSFDFLVFVDDVRYYEREASTYGKIYRIPNRQKRYDYYIRFFRIFFGVIKLIRKNKYDIIHCNNEFESGICCFAAALLGVKIRIVHTHTTAKRSRYNYVKSMLEIFYKVLLNNFSNVKISCSEQSGKSFFYKKHLFNVYPNSIDLQVFNTNGRKSDDGILNFVHVGNFRRIKNQIFIVKTIAELKKSFPKIKLVLVGAGDDYREEVIEEIKKHNLCDCVKILPSHSDIAQIFKRSDYMIFPSYREGLGIALLEAQASGVFCFASNTVPFEANAGMCNFYSLKDSPKIWAEKIKNFIIEDKKYEADMLPYSLENYIKKIDDLYGG